MKLFAALIAVLSFASSSSAAPKVLSIPAQGGPIRITPIFHGSLQIEYRGATILADPFAPDGKTARYKTPDLILITHAHPDHLDLNALKRITQRPGVFKKTTIYVPFPAFKKVQDLKDVDVSGTGYEPNEPMRPPEQFQLPPESGSVRGTVQAVPAYNLVRGPKPGQKFHARNGEAIGYVLTLGGKRIYIAGDTEATPEMKKLKNIDVAFLPMNLPFTMTPQEAAAAARAFKPKIVIPYHYRYPFDKPNSNPQQFAQLLKNTKIQVKLLDWYAR